MASEFQLDVESILANPNAQMLITVPGRATVRCFLQEGLGFSAGSYFGNAFESQAQNKLSDLYTKAAPAAGALLDKFGISIPSAARLQSFEQTTESWSGPQKPTFNMKTTFIAVKPTDDVTKSVKDIMAACFPIKNASSSIIQAPLNYGPNVRIGNSPKDLTITALGTVNMKIGTWFQAFGLIIESASPKFSTQVIKNGKPLYCEMNITLKPYRAISYGEFLRYFIS